MRMSGFFRRWVRKRPGIGNASGLTLRMDRLCNTHDMFEIVEHLMIVQDTCRYFTMMAGASDRTELTDQTSIFT